MDPLTVPPRPATPPAKSRPRWHLAYYFLAAFDVLTISTSLLLTHRIVERYSEALAVNRQWAAGLDRSAMLAQRAGAVNAPGNDVFETRDVPVEQQRADEALDLFKTELETTRASLRPALARHGDRAQVERLLLDLDHVDSAMGEMVGEARRIFSYIGQGKDELAGTRMAAMDRRYAAVNAAIASFNGDVRAIQNRLLDQEQTAAASVQKFEWLIAALILLIVSGVTLYGHRISREMARVAREREDHFAATARLAEELVAARDAALAAGRAKSAFLNTMSHELRTPLNGVLGMATLLLDTPLDDEQKEYASTVRSCGESLLALLDDILEYSKAEAGRLRVECVDVDVQAVVEDVTEMLAPTAVAKGLGLSLYVSPQLPRTVGGDPQRLRQVLTHLANNAIKFTERGEVQLRVDEVEECGSIVSVRFSVLDTGIGVPPATQQALFQPFTQVDASFTRSFGGTGMGLAICHRLVQLMGGGIEIDSDGEHGSCFRFTLPFETRSVPAVADTNERHARILCVVSHEGARHQLRRQLADWGHDADAVGDPTTARSCLTAAIREGRPFDLVISEHAPGSFAPDADGRTRWVLLAPPDTTRRTLAETPEGATVLTMPVRPSLLRTTIAEQFGSKAGTSSGAAALSDPLRTQRPRVLVAQDNLLMQRLLQLQLLKLGCDPHLVETGREAIEASALEPFDALVVDVESQEHDACAVSREIRARGGTRDGQLPIIVLTARGLASERQRLLTAGANDTLVKPTNLEALRDVLRRWVPRAGDSSTLAA